MFFSRDLITDSKFKSGFFLQGISSVSDQRTNYTYLNYEGKAIAATEKIWIMSQWWTPYDFKNANYKFEDNKHIYENESRKCVIDTYNGELEFYFDSSIEYDKLYGKVRDKSKPWSHFLIEQDFLSSVRFNRIRNLIAKLKFVIEEVEQIKPEEQTNDAHAAQFLWYITIKEGKEEQKESLGGNYIWFGIPLFDSRYKTIKGSVMVDKGFDGTTNALIYTMPSKMYLKNEPIELGKEYEINFDIFPYIKKAIKTAVKEKIFTNESDLVINYMNIGRELPGSFRVKSKISNLHLEAIVYD